MKDDALLWNLVEGGWEAHIVSPIHVIQSLKTPSELSSVAATWWSFLELPPRDLQALLLTKSNFLHLSFQFWPRVYKRTTHQWYAATALDECVRQVAFVLISGPPFQNYSVPLIIPIWGKVIN